MPIKYGNNRVFTVNEYRKVYTDRYPDRVAQKSEATKRKPQTSFWNMVFLWIVLLAINVMSAAHTIPTIQKFYDIDTQYWLILAFIGFAGTLGVEGTLIVFNAQTKRTWGITIVVVLTFIFAVLVNVTGSTLGIQAHIGNNPVFLFIGFVIGVVVPTVNVFAGEVIRHHTISRDEELRTIELEFKSENEKLEQKYKEDLTTFERGLLEHYRRYLKKVLGKDVSEEIIMEFISGVAEAEADAEIVDIPKPIINIVPEKDNPIRAKVAVSEVKQFIKDHPLMKTGEVASHFNISSSRVSQIKNAERK